MVRIHEVRDFLVMLLPSSSCTKFTSVEPGLRRLNSSKIPRHAPPSLLLCQDDSIWTSGCWKARCLSFHDSSASGAGMNAQYCSNAAPVVMINSTYTSPVHRMPRLLAGQDRIPCYILRLEYAHQAFAGSLQSTFLSP
jgi:hypothetical protein